MSGCGYTFRTVPPEPFTSLGISLTAVVVRRSIRARILQQSALAVILSLWDETEATHVHAGDLSQAAHCQRQARYVQQIKPFSFYFC
jgi:hypothetical protein